MCFGSGRKLPVLLFGAAVAFAAAEALAADPPGPNAIGGQKVLTLVVRDPPALRCNNNMQVAAELTNVYKLPVVVVPVAFAKPGTKAPAVWYGKDLIAEDGGTLNGMVGFTQIADILEIENVPKQPQAGRLADADVKPKFEALKQQIKQVP
ncbi:MAG: hypothetical protein F9K29_09805 [Hyphomicrobiaceae bacterium]|nr:MAG: hypothetical protein F9K29_09805 [Hyphomicrobiaceae bacterium]